MCTKKQCQEFADEFQESPDEFYDLIQPRLLSDSHGLGAKRHRAVIESLYQEYIDSMGKLTRERIQPLFVIFDDGDKLWDNETGTTKNDVL